ncbi:GNAT family N-acetyltransferase [Nocardioides sp. AN3]
MSRRVAPLTLDSFEEVRAPCRTCLFWELDPVRRMQVCDGEEADEKDAWLSGVLRDWGSCGRVVLVDDEPVGYVIYAPEAFVPGAASFPTAPVSSDAVLLTTAWIHPDHRGGGLGRILIQGMARDLIQRGGIRAVEAFGDRGPMSGVHGSRCAAPEQFLARVGFKTYRAHPTAPRLRMDLKSALRWREEVEGALERLIGVVRPKHPAPKATRAGLRSLRSRTPGSS